MRLLDRVAQSCTPVILKPNEASNETFVVTGSNHFSALVAACPLRYVLGDDLTRASAELAFADGARLADCMDLLRIPSPLMWVEWSDAIHKQVIYETGFSGSFDEESSTRRVGVLIQGGVGGRQAVLRTFWMDKVAYEAAEVILSPLETLIDLTGEFTQNAVFGEMQSSGLLRVCDDACETMSALLEHVRFRFDQRWAAYYRAAATTQDAQRTVVSGSLAAVARDGPLLLGFFLLLMAKDATRSISISRGRVNLKRYVNGHRPLLDHIEVNASLETLVTSDTSTVGTPIRQSPRLHHVRGHLVRREHQVFWRVPHLRGSASRGLVHSRTICLSYRRTP